MIGERLLVAPALENSNTSRDERVWAPIVIKTPILCERPFDERFSGRERFVNAIWWQVYLGRDDNRCHVAPCLAIKPAFLVRIVRGSNGFCDKRRYHMHSQLNRVCGMNLDYGIEDQAFRQEVRDFLHENLSEDMRRRAARVTSVFADKSLALEWQGVLNRRGWAVPSWPVEHGGTGWTVTQKYVFGQECASAGAPGLIPMGLGMLAPVLFKYGTDRQKAYYLPRILSGEHYWCQGYSEPGSGSDLASLKTSAVPDADDYLVNGTKIWTTHAQFADHIFCLVRTGSDCKPQQGITFLLIEMDRPGIEVKPIITLAGDHEVNQVFFDDVRVPQANRVGPEHQGWTVAKYLLEFERGGGGASARLASSVEELRMIAERESQDGTRLIDDPGFRQEISEVEIAQRSHMLTELMAVDAMQGASPGPGSSILKNSASDLGQRLEMLKVEAVGYYGLPSANHISLYEGSNQTWPGSAHSERAMGRYLNGRAASIFGGSHEIQKNVIAKRVLGL